METLQDEAKKAQQWKEFFSVDVVCPAPSCLLSQSLNRVYGQSDPPRVN